MPEERKYRVEDFALIAAFILFALLLLLCFLGILCPKISCPEGTYRCDICPEGCCLPGGYCMCPPGTEPCSKNCPQTINCPTGCCTPNCECSDKRCLAEVGCSCVGVDCSKCINKRCGGMGPTVCESDSDCQGIHCSKEGCKRFCEFGWSDCNGDKIANCKTPPNICFKGECTTGGCPPGYSDCNNDGTCECNTSDGRFVCCGGYCIDTQGDACYKDPNRKSCPPDKNGVDGCYDNCCPPNSIGWSKEKDCCLDKFGNCMYYCSIDEKRIGCPSPNTDACDKNGCCPPGAYGWDSNQNCCVDENGKCMYACLDNPSLDGCPPGVGNCPSNGCCPEGSKWNSTLNCCAKEGKCVCENPRACNPSAGINCCPGFGCVGGECKPCNEFSGNSCNDCPIGCSFNVTSKKCQECTNPPICSSASPCCCGFECKDGRCIPLICPYSCENSGCKIKCGNYGKCPAGFECCQNDDTCKKCINGTCGGIGPRTCSSDEDCKGSTCKNGQCDGCTYGIWNGYCCYDVGKGGCVDESGNYICTNDNECRICKQNGMCGGRGIRCTSDSDCTNTICSNGVCCPSGTTWNGNCCADAAGNCVGGCTSEETRSCTIDNCPGTQTCSNGVWGQCVKNDLLCGINLINCGYTGTSGSCIAGIQCNQQCLDGYKCPDPRLPPGQCKTSGFCTKSSECCCGLQCYNGVCCAAGNWRCYMKCSTNADCPSGTNCREGICK
jgi:hypothetical protein